jgi:hypothetical protein
MVPTGRLTEKVLEKRFSILPPPLQAAITSDDNLARVAKICSDNNITDAEKILIVQQTVSFVLLGFLHPDDITEELNEAPGFDDPKIVDAIVKDLNEKIFSTLGFDLKKNYAPIKAASISGKVGIRATTIEPQTTAPAGIPAASPLPLPPQNLSNIGWSKAKPGAPMPISTIITSSIPKPPTPLKSSEGEFARMKSPAVPRVASTPTPTSTPAPVILQQEVPAMSAAQKNADFHIAKSNENAQMEFSKAKEPIKVMPAIIEFNKNIGTVAKSAAVPVPAPSAARYTEFKSSLASIPMVDAGARNITEITSTPKAISVPVPAPKPPTPPMPPVSSVVNKAQVTPATTQKVIVQDFLEQPPK